jgi:hypothetical protein
MAMADPIPCITGVDFVCVPARDFECTDPDGNPLSLHHRYAPTDVRPSAA